MSNEITYNDLDAGDITNDFQFNYIDISAYTAYTTDSEVCFKLKVWDLQCKYSCLVEKYNSHLIYGVATQEMLDKLSIFRHGLIVLNSYNPRDIDADTVLYNAITYTCIQSILQTLYNKY